MSDSPPPLPLLSNTRAIKAIEIIMWTVISIAVIVSIDKRLAFLTI